MALNIWKTVFHDDTANMSLYDFVDGRGLKVQDNVMHFGSTELIKTRKGLSFCENFLRLKLANRYKDVDVTVKLEIESTAKTDGETEDPSHWFGIATRAVRRDHWDAYLFYIRKDGRVEFGIRGYVNEKPPPLTSVSSQAVTIRIKAEGDRVQTWVNNKSYHDWRDEHKEFIRKGDIYLITYASLVKIYEVEVKVKRWYAPLVRLLKLFFKIILFLKRILSCISVFTVINIILKAG
ncbi:MAG: hypothetical protein WBC22_12750 [Sedimentisphaerales bacterium]